MRLGCVVISSLPTGHGDSADQPFRPMYPFSREEIRAVGFADLRNLESVRLAPMDKAFFECAYVSTSGTKLHNTAARSFTRCGLFPVVSRSSMTALTISSSIPSVDIFLTVEAPGDGGGVCSNFGGAGAVRACFGDFGKVEEPSCDLFNFFVGESSEVAGGELL
jgi:hypothetical protein